MKKTTANKIRGEKDFVERVSELHRHPNPNATFEEFEGYMEYRKLVLEIKSILGKLEREVSPLLTMAALVDAFTESFPMLFIHNNPDEVKNLLLKIFKMNMERRGFSIDISFIGVLDKREKEMFISNYKRVNSIEDLPDGMDEESYTKAVNTINEGLNHIKAYPTYGADDEELDSD